MRLRSFGRMYETSQNRTLYPLAHLYQVAIPDHGLIFSSSPPRSRSATSMSYAARARSE